MYKLRNVMHNEGVMVKLIIKTFMFWGLEAELLR